MIKVMFICHGNICRSPMAEFIFKDIIKKAGFNNLFYISSSATSSEEIWNGIGNPIYPPAQKELLKHNISFSKRRAVLLTPSDNEIYDFLICMDENNVKNAKKILGESKKIYKLMNFAGKSNDVADPWYSGDFAATYRDITEGCKGLLNYLMSEGFINEI